MGGYLFLITQQYTGGEGGDLFLTTQQYTESGGLPVPDYTAAHGGGGGTCS